MPRFSANVSMLFCEHAELVARIACAARVGFRAVEVQFPYDLPASALAAALTRGDLGLALINLPAGDLTSGGPGLAAMPGREAAFAQAVESALAYAAVVRPRCVNVLPGWPPAELGRERCLDVLAGNLRRAAEAFAAEGIRVVCEACNTRDRPGFLLSRSAEVEDVLARAAHPNLAIQHDLYHRQIMEGDLIATLERLIARIGHIQFADAPGRHEPGTGEINFANLFAAIDRLGYDGWVGAEYVPSRPTEDTLAWLAPYTAEGRAR